MKQAYKNTNFRGKSLELLACCEEIIEELFVGQGLRLSLRQLYYQLVARNFILNNEKTYKQLGSLVSKARLAGVVDWDAIEDRGRVARVPTDYRDLGAAVEHLLSFYRLERHAGQDNYPELWTEKDALAGVLAPLADRYHVPLVVNKGYSSQSAMWSAAQRIDAACRDEHGLVVKEPIILYLGDLDPSGEDMVRDIRTRLNMFLGGWDNEGYRTTPAGHCLTNIRDYWSTAMLELEVRKIAITAKQVRQFDPPPNPTKVSDPRAKTYIKRFGTSSWEVDALAPPVLQAIVAAALESCLRMDLMSAVIEREEVDCAHLRKALGSELTAEGPKCGVCGESTELISKASAPEQLRPQRVLLGEYIWCPTCKTLSVVTATPCVGKSKKTDAKEEG